MSRQTRGQPCERTLPSERTLPGSRTLPSERILTLHFSEAEKEELRTGKRVISGKGLDLSTGCDVQDTTIQNRSMSSSSTKHIVRVFTDGSCFNNGKKNRAGGLGIHFPDGQHADVSMVYRGEIPILSVQDGPDAGDRWEDVHWFGPVGDAYITNQRAELSAIMLGEGSLQDRPLTP